MTDLPTLQIAPGRDKRARHGHPWLFSNELRMDEAARALPPGGLVRVQAQDGWGAVAQFNPHSLIAARILARGRPAIDTAFWQGRLRRALALRETLFGEPWYRLVNAEADGFPGLILDRYGDVVVMQANTAGMDRAVPDLLAAVAAVLSPRAVVLRNDSPVRRLEGLDAEIGLAHGNLAGPVEVRENGARFQVDLLDGQKTGWFFDQRDNRAFMARLARGRGVIDFFSYCGGFGVQAALAGAARVVSIDRSEGAVAQAAASAALNGVSARFEARKADAFDHMEALAKAGETFGVVICDPPAFIKSKKDAGAGARGYRKMAKLAAPLVEPGGFLFLASCSHHISAIDFGVEMRAGIGTAGRSGRLLRAAGAGPDHPLHPSLPESAYLKAEVYQLD